MTARKERESDVEIGNAKGPTWTIGVGESWAPGGAGRVNPPQTMWVWIL
jgi:hypothetical protein